MAFALLALWTGAALAECTAPVPMATSVGATARAASPRVGLALGSGSMHGLAHIGVIQELEARGVDVRVVTGTSVGALVGALWSSGLSGAEIEALSRGADWENFGRLAPFGQGLLSNSSMRDQLARIFKGRPMERWPRLFGAVATNLDNGERRILSRGDGATAVQASSAIPVLYSPVVVAGERLADGALVEPIPVDAARALGADFVVAIDVAYRPYEAEAKGIAALAFQSTHILINSLAASQLRNADLAIRLDLHHRYMHCGAESMVAAGRDAVSRAWPLLSARIARNRDGARALATTP